MNQASHFHLSLAEKGICVIAFYFALSFIFSDFSVSAVLGAVVYFAFAAACLVTFLLRKGWKEKKWQVVDLLLLVFLCTVLVNVLRNFSLDHTMLYYVIILGSSAVIFWSCGTVSRKAVRIAKGCLIGIALVFSLVNILYLFAPTVVTNAAYPLISETSSYYITRISWEGYGYAFGEDVGYTAEVIAMGICLLCTGMTRKNWLKRAPLLLIMVFALISVQRRGELLVCLAALVMVLAVGAVKSRKLESRETFSFKALTPLATQVGCIAVAFALFFSLSSNNRLSALSEEIAAATSQEVTVETSASETESSQESSSKDSSKKNSNKKNSNKESSKKNSNKDSSKKDSSSESGTNENTDKDSTTDQTETTDTDQLESTLEEIGNGRLILWQLAWEGFLEQPVLGHGWGAYAVIAPASGNTQVINAHCIYLQLLCETGVVGFLLVGAAFVGFLVLILKKIITCSNGTRLVDHQIALFILLFILGDGSIDNSLYQTHWMMLLTFGLLLVFRVAEPETELAETQEG